MLPRVCSREREGTDFTVLQCEARWRLADAWFVGCGVPQAYVSELEETVARLTATNENLQQQVLDLRTDLSRLVAATRSLVYKKSNKPSNPAPPPAKQSNPALPPRYSLGDVKSEVKSDAQAAYYDDAYSSASSLDSHLPFEDRPDDILALLNGKGRRSDVSCWD